MLTASRVRLEGERVKIETERNGLDQRLRESKEVCQGLEDDLKLLRGAKAQLEQANKQLQVCTGCTEAVQLATVTVLYTSGHVHTVYRTPIPRLTFCGRKIGATLYLGRSGKFGNCKTCVHNCVYIIVTNVSVQVDNQKVTESLTSSQQELAQYQAYSEQLNTQLANVNQELEETAQQRDEGIQTGREMSRCLTDLQNRVDGLEAQSEQLEQDKFRTQGALDTLQHEHNEVSGYVYTCTMYCY